MVKAFVEANRWLFLAALVFAPWAYGCTERWSIVVLECWLAAILFFWLVTSVLRKLQPACPLQCLICVGALLTYGWLATLKPQAWYDFTNLRFVPVAGMSSYGPATVDRATSLPIMLRISALLGIFCFVVDLVQRARWRKRLWWTVGITGTSLIAFGLIQRMAEAPMIFWEEGPWESEPSPFFFATYYYHGNAGAFINLVLPSIAGIAILTFQNSKAYFQKALWVPALFICVGGAFVNVSKAAMAITIILLLILVLWQFHAIVAFSTSRKLLLVYTGLVLIGLLSILAVGWDMTVRRWSQVDKALISAEQRWLAIGACKKMISDSGIWGFGPGTFAVAFPHYTNYLGNKIAGVWSYAHDDYIQTIIEWGWIGSIGWAFLLFGGIVGALYQYNKWSPRIAASDRILLYTSALALIGIALHATVDFPLQIASLQFYSAVLLGICWGSIIWTPKTRPQRG